MSKVWDRAKLTRHLFPQIFPQVLSTRSNIEKERTTTPEIISQLLSFIFRSRLRDHREISKFIEHIQRLFQHDWTIEKWLALRYEFTNTKTQFVSLLLGLHLAFHAPRPAITQKRRKRNFLPGLLFLNLSWWLGCFKNMKKNRLTSIQEGKPLLRVNGARAYQNSRMF